MSTETISSYQTLSEINLKEEIDRYENDEDTSDEHNKKSEEKKY
ncbi:7070_t:CDS:2 [Entrophospora sp. SA101]|nr:7070_t:CDS:2 [Entrophospora sp. SA101]